VAILKRAEKHKEATTPIVTHVTQVTISLLPDDHLLTDPSAGRGLVTPLMVGQAGKQITEHLIRVTRMMELLAARGFSFRGGHNAVHGFSSEVEAGVAKRLLLEAGFKDRDFQIVLEYTRGWGML
jgi:hypothetical protein